MTREEAIKKIKKSWDFLGNDEKEILETLIPELQESEEEKIRKWIIDDIRYNMNNEPLNNSKYKKEAEKAIAWLEKQKEFVSSDFDDVWETADCDELTAPLEKYSKDAIKEMCHAWYDKGIELERKSWLEKQGEQKPAKNIVEIWKDMRLEVYQQASGNRHEANYSDDTTKMFSLNDIDEIFEKISEQKLADKDESIFSVDNIHPATKEQRDTLFAAMKTEGYEWDAEKKELRKMEQKSDDRLDPLIDEEIDLWIKENSDIHHDNNDIVKLMRDMACYVATLTRNLYRQKSKWSYEDEANLNNIIWLCNNCLNGEETTWIPSQAEKIKHLIETIKERGLT